MRIIQCDTCGKRYKIKDSNNSGETSKYKCNACFQMIVVPNPAPVQDNYPATTTEMPMGMDIPAENNIEPPSFDTTEFDGSSENQESRALSLRTKFNIAIGAIVLSAIVLIYFYSGSRLQKDAEDQIFDKARLLLTTMEASRSFTSKVIKPALYKALPDRFITEGMSSSFGARNIFERIHKTYPQYYFKHAAPFPRNPINQADDFEMGVIQKFSGDAQLKEWQGYRTKGDEEVYSIMKPIVAEQRCMRCHSDPALAPQDLLDRYGDKNGFHRSVGEVIGTLTVSVPASVVIDKAKKNTIIFIGMVILFLALLTLIVNIFFSKMILKPIQYLADNADEISLGRLDTNINTSGGDEIAKLAKAFERMKISIKMAFDQLAR